MTVWCRLPSKPPISAWPPDIKNPVVNLHRDPKLYTVRPGRNHLNHRTESKQTFGKVLKKAVETTLWGYVEIYLQGLKLCVLDLGSVWGVAMMPHAVGALSTSCPVMFWFRCCCSARKEQPRRRESHDHCRESRLPRGAEAM